MRFIPTAPGQMTIVVDVGDRVALVDRTGRLVGAPQPVSPEREAHWHQPEPTDGAYWAVVDDSDTVLAIHGESIGRIHRGMRVDAEFPPDDVTAVALWTIARRPLWQSIARLFREDLVDEDERRSASG